MKNQEPHAAELSEVIAAANVNGKTVTLAFASYLDQIEGWREKAMALKVTSADQTKEMAEARTARLALKNIRVAADKLRKDMKAEPMAYCNTVQAVFNDIEGRIKPIEAHLQQQEDFAERQRADEIAAIRAHREAALAPFSDFVAHGIDWGLAAEADFERMLTAASIAHRIAAEKAESEKAEQEFASSALQTLSRELREADRKAWDKLIEDGAADEQAERDARAFRIQTDVAYLKARTSFEADINTLSGALDRGQQLLEALIHAAATLNQIEGPEAFKAHCRAVEVLETFKL